MDNERHSSVSQEEERLRVKLPKKLIVCCDGTWMNSDNGWTPGSWGQPGHLQNPSNVTRIARAIKSEDSHHHPQIIYYQAGVGTGIGLYNHLVGGGTGMGLAENVREAYVFIANNYSEHDGLVPNDSVFLLGFSRGAYTARTLGGFICAMGVLTKEAMPHFYECFEDWNRAGDRHHKPLFFDDYLKHHEKADSAELQKKLAGMKLLAKSKRQEDRDDYLDQYFKLLLNMNLTQKVTINAIGVWDTVGALGIPVNPVLTRIFPFLPSFFRTYRWFDTKLHDSVNNAYQALALDEHRFPYSPAIWEKRNNTTNLHQVWFPGSHSNVGGSYADAGMADITLAWMMDHLAGNTMEKPEEFKHHEWVEFEEEYIDRWYECVEDWYDDHDELPYRGWARGKVYDSNTFPQSLAGQRTRSPGMYHGTFYESGKTDWGRLLNTTNEQIHSSVRARMDLAARAVEPDWSQVFPKGWSFSPLLQYAWRWLTGQRAPTYQPQAKAGPLYGWRLVDGHGTHRLPNPDFAMTSDGIDGIHWKYEGASKVANPVLKEAKLGKYELMLLQKDTKIADKMAFTNNRWHWFKKPDEPQHYGRTF